MPAPNVQKESAASRRKVLMHSPVRYHIASPALFRLRLSRFLFSFWRCTLFACARAARRGPTVRCEPGARVTFGGVFSMKIFINYRPTRTGLLVLLVRIYVRIYILKFLPTRYAAADLRLHNDFRGLYVKSRKSFLPSRREIGGRPAPPAAYTLSR